MRKRLSDLRQQERLSKESFEQCGDDADEKGHHRVQALFVGGGEHLENHFKGCKGPSTSASFLSES